MTKKYEIVLVDAGQFQNKIISFIQAYADLDKEEATQLITSHLPLVVRKTNSKIEANIVKSQIEALGGKIEIRDSQATSSSAIQGYQGRDFTDELPAEDDRYVRGERRPRQSYSSRTNTYTTYSQQELHQSPVNAWDNDWYTGNSSLTTDYDISSSSINPIQKASGCLGVVLIFIFIFISGIIVLTNLIC